MKVLVTGKKGQLGQELLKSVPQGVELHAFSHHELDITSVDLISDMFGKLKPDYIINTAAYTAVDKAEQDVEKALAVNAVAAGNLARCARNHDIPLLHLSTDFVFDGSKSSPYMPEDNTNPLSVYGKSKAEGEKLIAEHYSDSSIILRTSWVYSVTGNNFIKTMLSLMKERDEIRVVSDQAGSPTWARNLALTIWCMINNQANAGIYHWSDSGIASWYDLAVAICEEAVALGLLEKPVSIIPINTSQYPTPAKRPSYSVLDITETKKIWGVKSEHWRSALRKMLIEFRGLLNISDELIGR